MSAILDLPSFPTRRSSDLVVYGGASTRARLLFGNHRRGRASRGTGPTRPHAGYATGTVVRENAACSGTSKRATPTSLDRKSTRLNSSHTVISYAVFCL